MVDKKIAVLQKKTQTKQFYIYFKRGMDIFISLVGLLFLLPFALFLKIAFLIAGDKDTIFFKQMRTGKNGIPFSLIKFRSMKIESDIHDFSKEDEVTKIGKILRRTSLDELPQLINILKGEMSFIGPRPWILEYYENMNEIERKRVAVLPGVTGLAQVNGRNGISIFDKINYDLCYVEHFSFLQDVKIIYKTMKTVFQKQNAYSNKESIKEEIEALKRKNRH